MAYGKCTNIAKPCSKALNKEIQDVDPANFVCAECGKPLIKVNTPQAPPPPPPPWKKVLIFVAIIGVIIAGIVIVWNMPNGNFSNTDGGVTTDTIRPDTIDTIAPPPPPPPPPRKIFGGAATLSNDKKVIIFRSSYTIDLKGFEDEKLLLHPNDKIYNAKIENGRLISGELISPNGDQRYLSGLSEPL